MNYSKLCNISSRRTLDSVFENLRETSTCFVPFSVASEVKIYVVVLLIYEHMQIYS